LASLKSIWAAKKVALDALIADHGRHNAVADVPLMQ
jgi:hypothetical protein